MDGRLRVLTFTSLFPNSCDPNLGIFIYQRSAHLAKRPGIEVEVVAPIPYFPHWLNIRRWQSAAVLPYLEKVGTLTVHHARYLLLPKISMPLHALSMFLGCLPAIWRINRREKIDCIDAHFVYPDGLAAVLLGKVLRIPVIVSARGSDINIYPSYRLIRPMIWWTLRQASALIAVSASLKSEMATLGTDESKIRVVPNGVDSQRFQSFNREEARKKLSLPLDGPLIVSVGALIPLKGHELLVRAFSRIATEHGNARLCILGEGPNRLELEQLIAKLGLEGKIQLRGKRPNEELPLWFNAADVSCLASTREGWPNVVTESLACGTPVVATRVGGIPEILHSTELGVVTEQSEEGLAAGLEQALSKKWDRQEISRVTRERTWETVAREVEEIIVEQMEKHQNQSI